MHWFTERVTRLVTNFAAVAVIAFLLIKAMPGNAQSYIRTQLRTQGYTQDQIEQRIQLYKIWDADDTILDQFVQYFTGLLQGDLGHSVLGPEVSEILLEALPWTVFLMSISLILTYIIGLTLGGILAYIEGSKTDSFFSVLSMVLTSIPYYLVALLLIFAFAYGNWIFPDVFPSGHRYAGDVSAGFNLEFIISVLHHATLPIASMVLTGFGGVAITMRANSISELGKDYMRVGRLRGLSPNRLSVWYLARNAVLPMYTGLFISISVVFGGSVIMEQIFAYPGVGLAVFDAVMRRDIFLMMGGFIFLSAITLFSIFLADLSYGFVDPRIGHGAEVDRNIGHRGLRGWLQEFRIWLRSKRESLFESSDSDSDVNRVGDIPERLQTDVAAMTRVERLKLKFDRSIRAPFRILWDDWRGKFGMITIAFYLLMGTVGVMLTEPASFSQAEPLLKPWPWGTLQHPFGTGMRGQDLVSAIFHATPNMLQMVLVGATFAVIVATVIGTISGFLANTVIDRALMFAADTVLTIPGLVLLVVITTVFQPEEPWAVGLILSIDAWPGLARALRSEVLSVREESYVEASNIIGLSQSTIIRKDILPNLLPYVSINLIMGARGIIFQSVGLYFLGILPFSQANWGIILNSAYNNGALYSVQTVHWLLVPLVTIAFFTIGLTLLAQSADRIFNPKTRARHAETAQDTEDPQTTAAD